MSEGFCWRGAIRIRYLSSKRPEVCYAVSEDDELDGKEIDLTHALETVIDRGMGTLLSCIPVKLAYFEDADCRWILERRS